MCQQRRQCASAGHACSHSDLPGLCGASVHRDAWRAARSGSDDCEHTLFATPYRRRRRGSLRRRRAAAMRAIPTVTHSLRTIAACDMDVLRIAPRSEPAPPKVLTTRCEPALRHLPAGRRAAGAVPNFTQRLRRGRTRALAHRALVCLTHPVWTVPCAARTCPHFPPWDSSRVHRLVGRLPLIKNRCEAAKNAMAIVFLADTPRAPPEFFSPVRAARRLRHDDHVPQAGRLGHCARHLHREAQLRQAQNTPAQEKKREFFNPLRI